MIKAELPSDEVLRLDTLKSLQILDTAPEERFDRITRMAKRLFGVPVSLVTLIDADRQWFKSAQGVSVSETSRDISFCGHTILAEDVFYIPDTKADKRFFDNPLVTQAPNIRFYAGCPLRMPNGQNMGTLCLIDEQPKSMDEEDKRLLRDLAQLVVQELVTVQLATLDELTMISNQAGFNILAQQSLTLAEKKAQSNTLIIFDLDNFKSINQEFGQAEGDHVLKIFANLLRQKLTNADVFARLDADVFVAMFTGVDEQSIQKLLESMSTSLDVVNQETTKNYQIGFSAGFVTSNNKQISLASMLDEADEKMYNIKKAKKS